MPINETLSAKPVSLSDVLSNGKRYLVPPFQRDYAWDESEWAELWADLVALRGASDERANHYLGALVLQSTERQSQYRIIDGQQRLVTLSLLALALIRRVQQLVERGVEAEDNKERVRLLQEKFVSSKDSASLQRRSRLELNETDNPFYETYLVQGREPSRPASLKGSNAKLYKGFQFFDRSLESLLGPEASGADLARFLEDTVALRLKFIEINVNDEETAFSVFETLNARGVALGTADLLKNFIFATAHKGGADDFRHAQMWWDQIVNLVPLELLATFLFHYLSTLVPNLREKKVFSEVKLLVPRTKSVFAFLEQLKSTAEVYSALASPESEFWLDYSPETRVQVRILDTLRVEQCRPVILAAFARFEDRPEKLARLLKHLVVVSLRAQVCRVNTGTLQGAYQGTALRVERGELKSPLSIARALQQVTPSDDEFRSAFSQLNLDPKGPRKRFVRHLLVELEVAFGGTRVDFDASEATIEHVLPENASDGWDAFGVQERLDYVRRLGNLTLLDYSANRRLGTAGFERKREEYSRSPYRMTQAIVQEEWTPAAINARQAGLADKAVAIWRIDDKSE